MKVRQRAVTFRRKRIWTRVAWLGFITLALVGLGASTCGHPDGVLIPCDDNDDCDDYSGTVCTNEMCVCTEPNHRFCKGMCRPEAECWPGPGGGSVSVAPEVPLQSSGWIAPSAGEALVGRPASCAEPVAGGRARVTRYAFARPGAADTSYVGTFDAPGGGGRQLGALALHRRAAGRDSLLAALATLEVGP